MKERVEMEIKITETKKFEQLLDVIKDICNDERIDDSIREEFVKRVSSIFN